jgi:hypothetical protein
LNSSPGFPQTLAITFLMIISRQSLKINGPVFSNFAWSLGPLGQFSGENVVIHSFQRHYINRAFLPVTVQGFEKRGGLVWPEQGSVRTPPVAASHLINKSTAAKSAM